MSLRILKWLMTMADSEGVGPKSEQLTTRNEKSLGCSPATETAAHMHDQQAAAVPSCDALK